LCNVTNSESNRHLNFQNQILLNKLVEISQGKQLSVAQHNIATQRSRASLSPANTTTMNHSRSRMSGFFSPAPLSTLTPVEKVKSLNFVFRKRENERIERENHGLAKRLFSNPSTISKREMDKEFQRQNNYKQMIARVRVDKPTFMGRIGSLPPLRNTI
jgi:hypothetical protein